MMDEWKRDDRWKDRHGAECSAAAEWAYVVSTVPGGNSRSGVEAGTGVGKRDSGNEGMRPNHFLESANDFVRTQAEKQGRTLNEEYELLDLEELLAIRLFTGTGFVVINRFLRQLALLAPDYRRLVARQPGVTYSATCANLMGGIRKLARFTSVPATASPASAHVACVYGMLAL